MGYAEEVAVSRLAVLLAGLAVRVSPGLAPQAANGSLPPLTSEPSVLVPLGVGLPIVGAAIAATSPSTPSAGFSSAPAWAPA